VTGIKNKPVSVDDVCDIEESEEKQTKQKK